MSKRDGKSLEELVAYIESVLVPAGLKVVTNDKVFDDDGNEIAEFDVIISGKVGSTDFSWLIECRDRPRSGAAPVSWIEQLVGRRDRFKLGKVTAVSTSGFAPAALDYGNSAGIELRHVSSLDPESFADWLLIREIEQIERRARLDHVTLLLDAEACEEDLAFLLEAVPKDIAATAFLKRSRDGQFVKCSSAFAAAANVTPDVYDDIIPNGDGKSVRLAVKYTNDQDHFVVETSKGPLRIAEIQFVGELSVRTSSIPILETIEYSTTLSGDPIAQVARFAEMGNQECRFAIEMRKIGATGETHVLARRVRNGT